MSKKNTVQVPTTSESSAVEPPTATGPPAGTVTVTVTTSGAAPPESRSPVRPKFPAGRPGRLQV
jgi:hypothetical protein